MFSKLAYAMITNGEIKLCISVNIYHRSIGMSTSVKMGNKVMYLS